MMNVQLNIKERNAYGGHIYSGREQRMLRGLIGRCAGSGKRFQCLEYLISNGATSAILTGRLTRYAFEDRAEEFFVAEA
jgi:hypothetical protein